MSRVDLGICGARTGLVVAGRREIVSVPGQRESLSVARARSSVEVSGRRVSVGVGAPPPAVVENPRLLSCHISALVGSPRVDITFSVWSHLGKIRYSVVNETTHVRSTATTYSPLSAAYAYAENKYVSGLTIGQAYTMYYWLDCIPDISGYTEQWVRFGETWTQPDDEGDPYVYDFSQA